MTAFSSSAIWQSNMAMSTLVDSPVLRRWTSAALTATAVKRPAPMSPIDMPTRAGGWPSLPVMLMMPPMPCTTMS